MAGGAELAELAHELEQLGGHSDVVKEVKGRSRPAWHAGARQGLRLTTHAPIMKGPAHGLPHPEPAPIPVPVRIGLIGSGWMGAFHAESIARRVPDAVLAAIADPNVESAEALAASLGAVKVTASADDILADPRSTP